MDFTLSWEKSLAQYRYKYLALYHALRSRIRDGSLPEGTRLPASRELAGLYGLSRGSVAQAYDMLLAEGYVSARVGRGTFVAAPFALEAGPAAVDGPAEKGAEGVDVQAWGVQAKGIEGVDVQAWRAQAKGAEGVDVQTWGAQAKGIEGVDVQAWRAQAKGAEGVHGQAWGAQAKGIEGVDADAGRAGAREIELSPWAQRLAALSGALREGAAEGREMAAQADPAAISFAGGGAQPPEAFPHAAWRSARARAWGGACGGS
ncbi:GntR family transcriptional regulator, partial [Paenibacillus pinistramenti]|uniref:GntR family transcriptional regulator n=1 Tax=Paenibacillus pinistramenti TaxID=1768003 RepID=UPI001107F95F